MSKNYGWQTAKSGPYIQFKETLMKESGLSSSIECASYYAEKWGVSKHSVLKWMRGERAIPERFAVQVFGAPIRVITFDGKPENASLIGQISKASGDSHHMIKSIHKMCDWCAGDDPRAVCPYWDCPLVKYTNKVVQTKKKSISMRSTASGS